MNVKKISREIKKYKILIRLENFCVTRKNTDESNFSPIELFIRYYVTFD